MSIKQTRGYEFHPNKVQRHPNPNNGIIITHMIDLIDKSKNVEASSLYDISDKNQFNEHFFYFRNQLGYQHYAYHLFFETYMNEIFGYVGCNISNQSEYLSELSKKNILNPMYKDYLLVVINGNLDYDICEEAMYTKVAYQISGIMHYEGLELKKIKFLEDIINKDNAKDSQFMFAPMRHFDRSKFFREISRFKSK